MVSNEQLIKSYFIDVNKIIRQNKWEFMTNKIIDNKFNNCKMNPIKHLYPFQNTESSKK